MIFKIHTLFLIVYVFAPFLHSEGSSSAHPTLSDICKKTGNADLCVSTIAPGFNGREVDASSALKEAIKVTTTRFEEAKKLADKLAHDVTTPRTMIVALESCSDLFSSTLETLQGTPRAIDSPSDPGELNTKLTSISTDADTCITGLHERSTVKSPLDPVASELSKLGGICLDISTQLGKSGDAARTCKAKGTTGHADPNLKVDPSLRDMCKETGHNDICISTTAPLLKGAKADALSALKAGIQGATSKFNEATQLVDKLLKEGKSHSELVKSFNLCNKKFQSALKDLAAAQKDLDGGDRDVGDKIDAAGGYLKTCKVSIRRINAHDSPVYTMASELSNLIEVCISFNIMLIDPKYNAPDAAGAGAATAVGSSSSSKVRGTAAQVHPTLSDICKKTGNADLCVSTIAPGFNGREADASSALKEVIRVTTTKFEEAKKLTDKLAHDATTPRTMIVALESCIDLFSSTLETLQATPGAVDSRSDPSGLNAKLTSIRTDADTCITGLHERSTVKSPLDPVASELSKLGGLCLDIGAQIHA